MKRTTSLLFSMLFSLLCVATPAFADSSCVNLLSNKINAVRGSTASYQIELTMHREGISLVSYSSGFLGYDAANNQLSGRSNQLFSDRSNGPQPFNVNAADQLDIRLSATGQLHLHYNPWNFDTDWDLACQGDLLTRYVPGFGVVTLTFREIFLPIQ